MKNAILPDLSVVITNFGQLTPSILLIIRAIAGMLAVVLTIHALFKFYRMSQENQPQQNTNIMGPLVELIVAGVLLALSTDLVVQNIVANLTTQVNYQMPPQFALSSNQSLSELRRAVGLAIENIMFLVGTIAIIRGLLVLKRMSYGDQNHKIGAVLTYLIAGSLALNINRVVRIFDSALGVRFSEVLFGR
jgi:hypothetical protein